MRTIPALLAATVEAHGDRLAVVDGDVRLTYAELRDEARRLYARHPRFLGYDPFFSPNLHPNDVNFVPNPN